MSPQTQGGYCFTLDDNIRFLEEATRREYRSIFEHPYPNLLLRLHQTYGTKFQMNMYYSYTPGGFSLADVPDRWKKELEDNACWLRFSFHARHNDPPFPYEHAAKETLECDYLLVMDQLRRIAGNAATDATTTLHYVCAPKEACVGLKKQGLQALIGMFLPEDGRKALRYYLSSEEAESVRTHGIWMQEETGLYFACNQMVLNQLTPDQIVCRLKEGKNQFHQVMIHEQYFYPDYPNYQPDFAQKMELPLKLFQEWGLQSCFLEELL